MARSEEIKRCGHVMTMTIDHIAVEAIRLMAPGPKVIGRFISQLIMQEALLREARAKDPEAYARVLRAPIEVEGNVVVATP
jgi:hypothetical protein